MVRFAVICGQICGRLSRFLFLDGLIAPHILGVTNRQASELVSRMESDSNERKYVREKAAQLVKNNTLKNAKELFVALERPKENNKEVISLLSRDNESLATLHPGN